MLKHIATDAANRIANPPTAAIIGMSTFFFFFLHEIAAHKFSFSPTLSRIRLEHINRQYNIQYVYSRSTMPNSRTSSFHINESNIVIKTEGKYI